MDFLTLKKSVSQRTEKDISSFTKIKIAILGDSATQFLVQALKGYGYEVKLNFEIYEADYNQIDLQIFDPNSNLYQFNPDYVIIFQSHKKLQKEFYKISQLTQNNLTTQNSFSKAKEFSDKIINQIENYYNTISSKLMEIHPHGKSKIIYFNFIESDDSIFGNYANKTEVSFLFQIKKINFELMKLSQRCKNLFINDINSIQNRIGEEKLFDTKNYVNADLIFQLDALPLIAKNITDIIQAISGNIKKCVILDLDNTLWGGIIGDDGIENIQIGNLGIGKAFTEFQLWLKQLKQRGILLVVNSKNQENIAKEPFEKHPEMVLHLDDFALFVANWNTKVENIKYIQSVLNINYDSMVFIDDSKFEREFVKNNFPQITVPDLPDDPAEYLFYLQSLNLFETASFTEEDESRTKQYQEEAERVIAQKSFTSEDDFLSSLNMTSNVNPFAKFDFPRIAQLTQRSNQFNLRTIRYTEEDIKLIAESDEFKTFSFTLQDKYGDSGLIAIVILQKQIDKNESNLFIDTFIMSCRVLKRTMENFILNEIVSYAKENNFKKIIGEYIPTKKNVIVKDLYKDLGFIEENNLWILNVDNYKFRKCFIKKI